MIRPRPWLAVAAVALTACGGDGPSDGALVELTAPSGWATTADGLVIAEDESDLESDTPHGPVIRAEVGGRATTDFSAIAIEAMDTTEAVEFGEPDDLTIDGFDTVTIALRADGRVVQTIVAHPPGDDLVVFTIDTPENRYEELRQVFDDAAGLRRP